ncbi:MAG TPA: inorganic diphosphatase [Candidatus Onthovivens sp.]|nr:inorganic diphosphatase [Candidatus Onthovivens sp.]
MTIYEERFKSMHLSPERFFALIEITKGSKNKYEIDIDTGHLKLDRILYTSTHYPHNYGFIPRTLADDGDSLDVLVICSEPILPKALVECKAIGVLKMIDGEDKDYKIMAVPLKDPFFNKYNDISELPEHMSNEIIHFFNVYKNLEGKDVILSEMEGIKEAKTSIAECMSNYLKYNTTK